jgi:hypothetical protein
LQNWLLLVYKVPRDPTANRVFVWRKLKRLGALSLQDAIWVLPDRSYTQEQFQWLASEIEELGGSVTYWKSALIAGEKEEDMIKKFQLLVEEDYAKLLKALKKSKANLAELSKQYQEIVKRDYFENNVGKQVRRMLIDKAERITT